MRSWALGLALFLAACSRAPAPSASDLVQGLAGSEAVASAGELAQNNSPEIVPALVAGLKHTDGRVRGQCARLLGLRKDVSYVDKLEPLLRDEELAVRVQAARALVGLLDSGEVLELLDRCGDSTPAQAALLGALLRDFSELGRPEVIGWLTRKHPPALETQIYVTLREAWSPCFRTQHAKEADLLAGVDAHLDRLEKQARRRALESGVPIDLRCSALSLYSMVAGPKAYETLRKLAQDSRQPAALREKAVLCQGDTARPEALQLMASLVRDPGSPTSMRTAALRGLSRFQDRERAIAILLEALGDCDDRVRGTAANLLGLMGAKEALPELHRARAREMDSVAELKFRDAIRQLEGRSNCCQGDCP